MSDPNMVDCYARVIRPFTASQNLGCSLEYCPGEFDAPLNAAVAVGPSAIAAIAVTIASAILLLSA
jgi:hypothetical protein